MARTDRQTIQFKHADFELSISAERLEQPLNVLSRTYTYRGLSVPRSPDADISVDHQLISDESDTPFNQPFFFENKPYWFDIEFADHVETGSASVTHKHRKIEESFSPSPRRNELRAMINFGNDIGQCNFEVRYTVNGSVRNVPIQFNVFATKMVQSEDLTVMNWDIDQVYPLWRYAITSKTTQSQGSSSRSQEKFELFWLAQFERLFEELNNGIKRILNAPHNRLQSYTGHYRLDRINKKLSAKQQEKASELLNSMNDTSRLRIERKRLSVDTPENRFIKMVLSRTKKNLSQIISIVDKGPNGVASDSYIEQLTNWRLKIGKHLRHQLWNEVGLYEGKNTESKVLQEAAGYSKVYRVWQQLKHYLNQASGESNISIKSVADIYEVWCFLEVRRIITSLGFIEESKTLSKLRKNQFERQFADDEMAAAFVFKRESDGMVIELAHNPSFTPKGQRNRTWLANQRPDIVLRVTLTNDEQLFILFDAKYRIDTGADSKVDRVPEDAINQMHRYRDAIIHQQKIENENPLKSRPVMGAFALYPGYFNQDKTENPYEEAIREIGIGAFALLPSADAERPHNQWLKTYLTRKLGAHIVYRDTQKPPSNDYYFVEDPARIVPYGSQVVRHRGLTMVAPINEINRDPNYIERARLGKLTGYHTQLLATNRQNVHRNIIREIRYLLLTVRNSNTDDVQIGKYLYRVGSVKLVRRREIDDSVTGKASNATQNYWLFEFSGKPIKLSHQIERPYSEHFEFKLTKAEYLDELTHWNEIDGEYQLYADLDKSW